jgi:hypothetical protein
LSPAAVEEVGGGGGTGSGWWCGAVAEALPRLRVGGGRSRRRRVKKKEMVEAEVAQRGGEGTEDEFGDGAAWQRTHRGRRTTGSRGRGTIL